MRDYDRERDKPKVIREYGSTTSIGKLKPYNELLTQLGQATRHLAITDANEALFKKLAWFLGEQGEVHACEIIMEHLNGPRWERQLASRLR